MKRRPKRRPTKSGTRFREAKPISAGIDRLLTIYGLKRDVADTALFSAWPQIVGERIASFTRPARIDKSRVLHIAVASSSWLQELTFLKPAIMEHIENYRADATHRCAPIQSLHFFLS